MDSWGPEEVAAWLEALDLGEYKELFMRHDIQGSELMLLERRDLKVHRVVLPAGGRGQGVRREVPLLLLAHRMAKLPPPAPLTACPSTKAQGGAASQPPGWERGLASSTPFL